MITVCSDVCYVRKKSPMNNSETYIVRYGVGVYKYTMSVFTDSKESATAIAHTRAGDNITIISCRKRDSK